MFLKIDNLVKMYKNRGIPDTIAVNGVSLQISEGEFITMLGPSGCGKTTTLRLIAGLEFPTDGSILLDGCIINTLPSDKRDISLVFQNYALFPHMTVYENIAYGLNARRSPRTEVRRRTERMIRMTGLSDLEERMPRQLSGGEQQRVALARALVTEPKLLLMDEPLSNLDLNLRDELRAEIRDIQRNLGITTVYVTHDQAEAMALSDRIAVLNAGKIEQVGTPEDIYCRPQTRFVAEFIGRANIITGIVRSCDDGNFVLHALGTALTIPTRGGEYYPGQQATIVIRPEMIEVNVQRPQVMGIVRQVIYLGNVTQYQVDVHDHMITLFEHGPRHSYDYSSGQDIPLRFLESCLYVLPAKMSNPIGVAA